jgi:hypothetical protein
MEARSEELERIGKFFEKGMLKASVDSVWVLEEFTAGGHARGKVVLKVEEDG